MVQVRPRVLDSASGALALRSEADPIAGDPSKVDWDFLGKQRSFKAHFRSDVRRIFRGVFRDIGAEDLASRTFGADLRSAQRVD